MHALLLWKPRYDICLRFTQKLVVMLESRVIAVVSANQPVEVVHQFFIEEVLEKDVAVTIELFPECLDVHHSAFSTGGKSPLRRYSHRFYPNMRGFESH